MQILKKPKVSFIDKRFTFEKLLRTQLNTKGGKTIKDRLKDSVGAARRVVGRGA